MGGWVKKTQQIWNHHETPCSLGALHFLHLMTTVRAVLPPHVSCTGCCMSHTATEWGQEEMEIYPTKYPFYEQGWLRSGDVSDLSGLCPHIPHSSTRHLAVFCLQWALSQCYLFSGWQDSVKEREIYINFFSESKPSTLTFLNSNDKTVI